MFDKSRLIVGGILAAVAMIAGATMANNANADETRSVCAMVDWTDTVTDGVKVSPIDLNGDGMIDCTSLDELGM